jgi:hypothetical protein
MRVGSFNFVIWLINITYIELDVTKRIIEYLNIKTNYAIVINGKYGIGKTHFIKKELFPAISEISIEKENDLSKITPIFVSLFGVNTIEEIQSRIFVELYPLFKSKGLRIAAGFSNILIKYFTNTDVKDFIKETDVTNDFVDYSRIFICFDDLDRKGNDLTLDAVYGFINNLVENNYAKVLIVSNETELLKEFKGSESNYSSIIEKVIGASISYNPKIDLAYVSIVDNLYLEEQLDYHSFVIAYKDVIIEQIDQNDGNLRNLVYFLEHFKILFLELTSALKNDTKLDKQSDLILRTILDFALPIAIEYKMGRLNSETFEKIKELYKISILSVIALGIVKPSDEPMSYEDVFRAKYLKNRSSGCLYFDSIFLYLTGQENFDLDSLLNEIISELSFEDKELPLREIALNKLNYWVCLDLTLADYRLYINILLENIDSGAFKLNQYPLVFDYIVRFDNILGLNISKLVRRFKKGINKGVNHYAYNHDFSIQNYIDSKSDFYSEKQEIFEFCNSINGQLQKEKTEIGKRELLDLFCFDFRDYYKKVNDNNSRYSYNPYLDSFISVKFWNELRSLKNQDVIEFGMYIKNRFGGSVASSLFIENSFLLWLENKLTIFLKSKKLNKLNKVSYLFLLESVSQSVLKTKDN